MLYALVFTPTLGAHVRQGADHEPERTRRALHGDRQAGGAPSAITVLVLAARAAGRGAAGPTRKYGAGVEFFPNVEPDYGLLYVHARGNLSLDEMDRWRPPRPRQRMLGWPGIKSVYTRVGKAQRRRRRRRRRCGRRHPVRVRRLARAQVARHRSSTSCATAMAGIPGVDVEVRCRTPARRPARRSRCSCRRPIPPGSTTKARAVADTHRARCPA